MTALPVDEDDIWKWERDGGGQDKLSNAKKISEYALDRGLQFATVGWILGIKFRCFSHDMLAPTQLDLPFVEYRHLVLAPTGS